MSEYEIESIFDHEVKKSKLYYLVKWKGYSKDQSSWIYEEDLYADELVQQYWTKLQSSKSSNKSNDMSGRITRSRNKHNKNHSSGLSSSNSASTMMDASSKDVKTKKNIEGATVVKESRHQKPNKIKVTLDKDIGIDIVMVDDDDWENKVSSVESIIRDDETEELSVFLRWKNGKVSKHSTKEVNAKCPQKIIDFYEKRLLFTSSLQKKK
ncbi:4123_t:CDS:2 [Entrophospora sp. SA101]|nr:1019_t:CDS:2 [Entrophospora sp. SA101]CAJ0916153.1 4118_t:CDS:2 [Entrophospora sp. SA101]CAJ0916159.1 4120_t:CDS:2 [Entrophospora sp. SA101]CAJ0916168.1 4123_t:CDS:2 [Entrophospora sp. SA101]